MSRNSKLISENLKEEIAKVSSKNCGNIVKKALEIANRSVEK